MSFFSDGKEPLLEDFVGRSMPGEIPQFEEDWLE